jgi:phosphoribosylformimino-5-aminoimidazole carboxamide ribotide isomerase
VYSADPRVTAKQWIDQGATWLHVVNLDGALSAANDNEAVVRDLAKISIAANVKIQFGGGLRTALDIVRLLEMGIGRVVIGTLAVIDPELVGELVTEHGADRIALALDARNGFITTHGWQQGSALTPAVLGKQFAELGARHALYTDVGRDGLLGGVDAAGTAALARETGLDVIASGGVRDLDDIQALSATKIVAGVILGTALYEGKIALPDALRIAAETH